MFTIHLHHLRFFSFHGVHEEESILGNDYEVNADVTFTATEATVTALHQTINYVKIYDIIKQQMHIPTALLETVAQDLAEKIYAYDQRITSININIKKEHPPIPNFTGSVGVSYKKDF
ncbi:dihydroneopterin aldolase [Ferruginibacter profundus]